MRKIKWWAACFAILAVLGSGFRASDSGAVPCDGSKGSCTIEENTPRADCLLCRIVGSLDPNDFQGPGGSGALRYLRTDGSFAYQILFENLPTATAPAQVVRIVSRLDSARFLAGTLELGPIEFADTMVVPPPGSSSYSTIVDLRPAKPLLVRIQAGMIAGTDTLGWILRSEDPLTGEVPDDPLVGFLPPDNPAPHGQGSVSFLVQPRTDLAEGASITGQADITFDLNAPIATPVWTNTVDNHPPNSQVLPLAATQDSTSFVVTWTGSDGGSGIRDYDVYVSANYGSFYRWAPHIRGTNAMFEGDLGSSYRFYSVARDDAGNVEASPTLPDDSTRIALTTDVALSLVTSRATPNRAVLNWYSETRGLIASVERRTAETIWSPLAEIRSDGSGHLVYADTTVAAGARYGYRLSWKDGESEDFGPEAWLDIPKTRTFGLTVPSPIRAGPIRIACSLPGPEPADLSIFDVTGRRLLHVEVASDDSNPSLVDLRSRPRPGVYYVVLRQGPSVARSPMVVLR